MQNQISRNFFFFAFVSLTFLKKVIWVNSFFLKNSEVWGIIKKTDKSEQWDWAVLDFCLLFQKNIYRKFAIDRPGGKQFLAAHNFWTSHLRIVTYIYSDNKICILSEYNCIIVLRCVVQNLCVAENCLPLGQSIANLRYKIVIFSRCD